MPILTNTGLKPNNAPDGVYVGDFYRLQFYLKPTIEGEFIFVVAGIALGFVLFIVYLVVIRCCFNDIGSARSRKSWIQKEVPVEGDKFGDGDFVNVGVDRGINGIDPSTMQMMMMAFQEAQQRQLGQSSNISNNNNNNNSNSGQQSQEVYKRVESDPPNPPPR